MIRLTRIELDGVKNIRHGAIDLYKPDRNGDGRTADEVSSVTGIYGQNGSGKTSVIEAIQVLRLLMVGEGLKGERAGILVNRAGGAGSYASLHAEIQVDDTLAVYTVVLEACGTGLHVVRETLAVRPDGDRRRILVDYRMARDEETGLLTPTVSPTGAWNSLTALQHADDLLRQEAALAYSQNRSLLFSKEFSTQFTRISGRLHAQDALPAARRTALDRTLDPLLDVIRRLARFADNGIRVVTTRQGASVCFGYTPFIHGGRFDILDIGRPCFVPAAIRREIEQMVEQANLVLPVVIPGLKLECEMKEDVDEAGEAGARVFLYSSRGGVRIPFWAESEGIRRIVGILSLLVRMFNETDTCIAIDEIDSGIFEVLLGDILRVLAQRGRGQLVFTAHNLRVLEVLDHKSIVFSTADPDNRFVQFANVRAGNNLRDMYIRSVSLDAENTRLAQKVKTAHVAVALSRAGRVAGGRDE
ncbi:AAA family ATPase [Pseudoscardovia suis]|uniref:AAA domain-containing protein n=1 Tax=Pseudoscardovia suis TaxID=987063 RepID=A0A261EZ85_9BIFI|nr:AAA family ATPase [Pseudoscardovia suis]OZG51986.1 AAA domain-containing protein [Pseudoscardovia suis]PJJ69417.1 putative AbiEii toxin of type IV toxin-antitoxin system [Pseudoscardovia suis]